MNEKVVPEGTCRINGNVYVRRGDRGKNGRERCSYLKYREQ